MYAIIITTAKQHRSKHRFPDLMHQQLRSLFTKVFKKYLPEDAGELSIETNSGPTTHGLTANSQSFDFLLTVQLQTPNQLMGNEKDWAEELQGDITNIFPHEASICLRIIHEPFILPCTMAEATT